MDQLSLPFLMLSPLRFSQSKAQQGLANRLDRSGLAGLSLSLVHFSLDQAVPTLQAQTCFVGVPHALPKTEDR